MIALRFLRNWLIVVAAMGGLVLAIVAAMIAASLVVHFIGGVDPLFAVAALIVLVASLAIAATMTSDELNQTQRGD